MVRVLNKIGLYTQKQLMDCFASVKTTIREKELLKNKLKTLRGELENTKSYWEDLHCKIMKDLEELRMENEILKKRVEKLSLKNAKLTKRKRR